MALDAAFVVRTGSGALWLAMGALILALGWRRRDALLVGGLSAAFGAQFVLLNLVVAGLGADVLLVVAAAACWSVATCCGFLLAWRVARGSGERAIVVGAGLVLAIAVEVAGTPSVAEVLRAAGVSPVAADLYARLDGLFLAEVAALATLIGALALRARARGDARPRAAAKTLALSFGLYAAYSGAVNFIVLDGPARGALFVAPVAAALLWLPAGRQGRSAAWSILGAALAGLTAVTWLGEGPLHGVGVGILRSAGVALLALAVFRQELLGIPLPRVAEHRGVLAASALAALFITAEVAQNFLSDALGLLMGGVVAGALVFAASPIQRALEERGRPRAPTPRASRAEDVYRKALRVARHDGHITPEEDRHLAEVADALGLSHAEAARVRREVEEEAGA